MTARVPERPAPASAQIRQQFAWLPKVLRLVAIPVMAWLWWALAFLPWTREGLAGAADTWPPTLPILFRDLEVALFMPIGAAIVVVAVVRRGGLALASVLLGLAVSAAVTLTRPADAQVFALGMTERQIMIVVCGLAALAGLVLGVAAIKSLQVFGFLGLLAVLPVVSLISVLLFGSDADNRWLIRGALVALLVMVALRRWTGVLVWPLFFALFWLLGVAMAAVGYGAGTLRRPGRGVTIGTVAEAMLDLVRTGWRQMLGDSWRIFWPAAVIAALMIGGLLVWRRFRGPSSPQPTASRASMKPSPK